MPPFSFVAVFSERSIQPLTTKKIILQKELIYMKEITFAYPLNSSITRTIKVCETQKELIKIIRERRSLKNGTVFVLYKDNSYFFQLLGSDGYKTSQFKRYGIKSATVSSSSGELFIFGGFSITPDGLVAIDENTIKKYGLYSGQYDVNSKFDEPTDFDDEITIDEIRRVYSNTIDYFKHNSFYSIDEECRQVFIYSKLRQLDFINDLWERGIYYDSDGFFSRKVNSYNLKTGDFGITVKPSYYYNDCPYDCNVICSECQSTIRFALYLLGR